MNVERIFEIFMIINGFLGKDFQNIMFLVENRGKL